MPDINLINIILIFPLIIFPICQFLGKRNNKLAGILFCISTLIILMLSALLLKNNQNLPSETFIYNWFSVSKFNFNFSIILDNYSLKMLVLVNFISILVGVFSLKYMEKEENLHRYFGFIALFLFAMEGIILSGNLFQMYFFWELVGFSSYLLIGFWYHKKEAINAAKKAFLMNRIGDICLLFGIFLLFFQNGNTDLFSLKPGTLINENNTLIGLMLFGGCIAKSAQFPLHTWLPDAMEGPTPVSALIHAATMVAAGIYLIIRIFPIFTPTALVIISAVGCISMLMGGIKAIFQTDIKKVLAYSTISQLGLMVLAVGGGYPNFGFNHLLTHAFFKAGLFLSAGSVIYAVHLANPKIDAQNMLLMGNFRRKMPVTFISFCVFSASMMGLPLFSGFITKDQIIEIWQHSTPIFSKVIFISLLISSLLSALYMSRALWLVFLRPAQIADNQLDNIKETPWQMTLPLIILAVFSTFLVIPILNLALPELNSTAIISTSISLLGILLFYLKKENLTDLKLSSLIDHFYQKYIAEGTLKIAEKFNYWDINYIDGTTKLITNISISISKLINWFDIYFVDGSVKFLVKLANFIAKRFSLLQNGQLQWYFSAIALLIFALYVFL